MTNKLRQFIRGMGSAIDLGATSAHAHTRVGLGLNLERTHAEALGADWDKLANDFGSAFKRTVGGRGAHGRPR
jgi:hypothetical protein